MRDAKNTDRLVPKLRFKGFTDDWKQRKLGKVFSTITDYVANGSFKSLHENVKTYSTPNYAIMIRLLDASNNWQGPWIYTDRHGYDFLKKSKLYPDDILLSNVGAGVGKTFLTPYLNLPMTLAPNAVLLRSSKYNNKYLYCLINTPQTKISIKSLVTYSAQPKLNKTDLKRVTIVTSTDLNEENNIADLFNKVEKIISIQERKLELLNKTTKSLIQRIFKTKYENPTLYLRNIAQIWNLIQIKEIGNIVTGNTPSTHNTHYYSNSGKPWVTPVDLTTENTLIKQSSKRLTNEGWRASRHVPKNSILITSIGSIGKNGLTQSETAFNQQINALVPGKGHDPYFLLKNSQIWSQEMSRIAGQSTLPIVNKTEFSKLTTYLPLIESEKIIGKLFFKFDNYIQKEQKKLSQLKQIKKFLLQNMFI